MQNQNIVGSWKLLHWEAFQDGASIGQPFGEGALGQVVISESDHMGAHLQAANWPEQPEGTGLAAFFVAYSGKFRMEEDRLITSVAMASTPAMVGTEQVRVVSFIGERMQLEVLPEFDPSGRGLHQKLLWERC